MAVLVTGGSGFLGGRLAQMLQQGGEEVVLLARPNSDLRHLSETPVRLLRGDLSDAALLREAVQSVTHIFHCAACSTDWASWQTYFETNVVGTRNLLDAARHARGLQRFVHVSTTDIYGYPPMPCDEDHPSVETDIPYNRTKIQGEEAVWKASREDGLPVTVLRPATIYGPRGKDFTQEIAALLRQRIMITIDGGTATGGFTYVDTVAQAMLDASVSRHTVGQAYNIADGTGATWAEYLRLFAEQLGLPAPWLNLSFAMAMRLAHAMEAPHRWLHLDGRPLLTRHAVYLLGRSQEFPATRARTSFGFTPSVSLDEGVRRSVEWLRNPCTPKRRR